MIEFPKGFLWGAATSAHQVEGNNINSDWWEWEKRVGLKDVSGQACRHYDLFRQDFDLAKQLNHNCHRLSVEWARIEPEEGKFSQAEIEHYKEVILALRQRNLEPIVTLYHFTLPLWLAKRGGWENNLARKYFLRYADKVVSALCRDVKFWSTINEPLVYAYHAYILGVWPPQKKSVFAAQKVENNLAVSHIEAYSLIHGIYRRNNLTRPSVSIAKNVQAFFPCVKSFRNKFAVYLRNRCYNLSFIDRLIRHKSLDYIGINYYSRNLVDLEGWSLKNFIMDGCNKNHSTLKKNSMGWDIYPQGLYDVLMEYKKYNLPVMILENGICTDDDSLRWDFIRGHLKMVSEAINSGLNVTGYVYWSLIDNFEWDKGFGPRFGLIEIDYSNFKRTIRQSALNFGQVCLTGKLD